MLDNQGIEDVRVEIIQNDESTKIDVFCCFPLYSNYFNLEIIPLVLVVVVAPSLSKFEFEPGDSLSLLHQEPPDMNIV